MKTSIAFSIAGCAAVTHLLLEKWASQVTLFPTSLEIAACFLTAPEWRLFS